MDGEFRQAFALLSGQIADVGRDAREGANLAKDALAVARRAEAAANKANERAERVELHVFGGPPPPPPAPSGSTPLVARASRSEEGQDELKGQFIKLDSFVRSELEKQSKAMGIGVGLSKFFRTAAGRDFAIRVLTLVLAALGAGKAVLASSTPGQPSSHEVVTR